VTSSGERDSTVNGGGQAAAVRDALVRILTRIPETDEEEETPFGTAYHKQGIPLWKTLFRDQVENLYDSIDDYLQPLTKGIPKDVVGRFAGLDKVTGKHMLYVAWKDSSTTPIVVRASIVPEMGNKARIVTMSPYWVNVLQAPLAHLLVEAMKFHPSAFSSFHRQDQAWDACKGLCNLRDISLEGEHYVLSSDLTDATNTQQFELTKVMLKSFIEGFTGNSLSPYMQLVLDTIGPRLVLLDDTTTVLSSTGIMMGEAIAKPSLTLLNLSIEEAAFLSYNNKKEYLMEEWAAPDRAWRYFHVGGDDHLAKGPLPYLNLITDYHRRAGSHISVEKHGVSKICVRYCERVINMTNLQYRKPFDEADYSRSTMVDTVKVRLLERGQSTMMLKDNKNVAIGKSQQLAKVLTWLPKDNRFYTRDKITAIRSLFISRMGPLLPSKVLHPRAHAAIHLPTIVGGYGLGLPDEYDSFLRQSPEPTRWLLSKHLAGMDVSEDLNTFRKLNRNVSARGIPELQDIQDRMLTQLREYPKLVNAITWTDLKQQFPNPRDNNRQVLSDANIAGYQSFSDYVQQSLRGNLFQELLCRPRKLNIFNTRAFVQTYKYVWSECESTGMDHYGDTTGALTSKEIAKAIDSMLPQWYFDTNQLTTVDIGFWGDDSQPEEFNFVDIPYREKYTQMLPDLLVGKHFVGCDSF
jgi:hypothetical protein